MMNIFYFDPVGVVPLAAEFEIVYNCTVNSTSLS